MGPEYKRYIWWKKYLTGLQIVQFVIIFLHTLPLFMVKNCGFPSIYGYLLIPEVVMFLFMFSNFYKKSYTSKKAVNVSYRPQRQHSSDYGIGDFQGDFGVGFGVATPIGVR